MTPDPVADAQTLLSNGDTESCEATCKAALDTPTHLQRDEIAALWHLLAVAQMRQGMAADARQSIDQALKLSPDDPTILYNSGTMNQRAGNVAAAVSTFRQLLKCEPKNPAVLRNCGAALTTRGELGEAIELLQRATAVDRQSPDAWLNLGNALRDHGRAEAALRAFERVVALAPNDLRGWSNALLCCCYLSDENDPRFAKLLQRFGSTFSPPDHQQLIGNNTPLRVGFLSPDLKRHSVAFFVEALLSAPDASAIETVVYCDVERPDNVTKQLRQLAGSGWHDVAAFNDDQLKALITADKIEILVDLTGHTANNRIGLFAACAAPLQVSYLGYPATTGLSAIDYRLVDAISDPADADEPHAETLVRLPNCFLCYAPPTAPTWPPRETPTDTAIADNSGITFGSFNALAKLNPSVVALWARLLLENPESRLLLKGRGFAGAATRARFMELFAEHDVDGTRVELRAQSRSFSEHLASYGDVDIALDPFPYNGTTTTCEALFMGVPVITLCGHTHRSRVGASLLTTIGHPELIATSPDQYSDVASALSHDREGLATMRDNLRREMLASPLCDAESFRANFFEALRKLSNTRVNQTSRRTSSKETDS